jgi:hypothetical protein
LHAGSLEIGPEEHRDFTFSHQPGDYQVLLVWEARVDADRQGGGGSFLHLEVNGTPLRAVVDRLNKRLMNKPPAFTDARGKSRRWYSFGDEAWMVPFSPDFSAPGPGSVFSRSGGEAYRFVVDVTELVQETNTLTFENRIKKRYVNKYRRRYFQRGSGAIVLKNVRLETMPRTHPASPRRQGDLSTPAAWDLTVEPSGQMVLNWGDRTAKIKSSYAKGDGTWIKTGRGDGVVEVGRQGDSEWTVKLRTPFYDVHRRIQRSDDEIRIVDRFVRRRTADPVAVLPRYEIEVQKNRFGTVWIGGDQDPLLNEVCRPFNPTLFIPMDGVGLGMVVEDDVLRLQGSFSYDAEKGIAVLKSDELVVSEKGGNEYTAMITLLPTLHDSYWEFVSDVRKRNGVRATMPGTIRFTYPEKILAMGEERLTKYLGEANTAYVVLWDTPSPLYHALKEPYVVDGVAQIFSEGQSIRRTYEENLGKAARAIRGAESGVKVLFHVHSHTCSFFDKTHLDDFRDSLITDRNGLPVRRHGSDRRYVPLYLVYPSGTNSYGDAFARYIDHVIGLGSDGLYWDEISTGAGPTKYTYSEFDGYTADVEPQTQRIMKKKALVSLLSKDYKADLVKKLVREGKAVHANGAPDSSALDRLPITYMVETKISPGAITNLHLSTPYAYVWGTASPADFKERLLLGGVCFQPELPSSGFIADCFPLTVDRLEAGYVAGEERVITCRSGAFGWKGPLEGGPHGLWGFGGENGDQARSRRGRNRHHDPPRGVGNPGEKKMRKAG